MKTRLFPWAGPCHAGPAWNSSQRPLWWPLMRLNGWLMLKLQASIPGGSVPLTHIEAERLLVNAGDP